MRNALLVQQGKPAGGASMEAIRLKMQAANDPYRTLNREQALAAAFHDFVQRVLSAGWNEPEVALTLADIADDYVMALARRVAN
ncbi:hypothetical protein QO004_001617 [Rhizobium mesoamericanum]|nr:hypothetical protein [Rhizobium mesoamericanum]